MSKIKRGMKKINSNKNKSRRISKDRKAWLRIVEAFIAVLIVLGAVLVIVSKQQTSILQKEAKTNEQGIYEKQSEILDIVSKNESLRTEIVGKDYPVDKQINPKGVNNLIYMILPSNWNFMTRICEITGICPNPMQAESMLGKEVYTEEKIITTGGVEDYNPKKLKMFIWFGLPSGWAPTEEEKECTATPLEVSKCGNNFLYECVNSKCSKIECNLENRCEDVDYICNQGYCIKKCSLTTCEILGYSNKVCDSDVSNLCVDCTSSPLDVSKCGDDYEYQCSNNGCVKKPCDSENRCGTGYNCISKQCKKI